MECSEARWLLDRGLEPGSRHPTRTRLGFHLAQCNNCRAYHQQLQQLLLADLLLAHTNRTVLPIPVAPSIINKPNITIRRVGIGLALVVLLLTTLFVGRVVGQTLTIRQHVQSYIVPTPVVVPTRPTLQQKPTKQPDQPNQPNQVAAQIEQTAIPDFFPQDAPINNQKTPEIATRIPIMPTAIGATPIGLIPTLPAVTATPRIPVAGSAITVLLLGSDARPGEDGPSRTDTIIIARIDPNLRRVALLSIPRDMIVNIPGYGYSRINAAHVYGDIYPELGGGMALARQTIGDLIGVPIDYAVLVNFQGFTGLIDAIGGIDLNVPNALYDDQYPTMDYGYMVVSFDPGQQHMDGTRALEYARIRHMDSDFERARRQQEVILAAARQVRSHNPIELLDRVSAATDSLRGYVWTDMPEDKMIGIAWALRDLAPETVQRYFVDETIVHFNGEGGGCSSADDYWAACYDPATLQALVAKWLGN